MPSEALAEEGNSSAYPNRQRDRVESALSGRSSRPADTILLRVARFAGSFHALRSLGGGGQIFTACDAAGVAVRLSSG